MSAIAEGKRDSFLFYRSFYEAARQLPKRERSEYILSLCDYVFEGVEPKVTGSAAASWILTKPVLDANLKRRKNGAKGGRPPAETKPPVTPENEPMVPEKGNQSRTDGYSDEKPNIYLDKGQRDNGTEGQGDIGQQTEGIGVPPRSLLSEIESFCLSHGGTTAEAAAFYAQYERTGWKAAGKPIENWKGLCLNFLRAGGGKGDKGVTPAAPQPGGAPRVPSNARKNVEWMRQLLEEDEAHE